MNKCERCTNPAAAGHVVCADCLRKMALYARKRYQPTGNPPGRPRKH